MLLCTPSAYGQGTAPSVTATYTIDPMAVDLGFVNFYWSKRNLGAENSSSETFPGNYNSDYYDFYDVANSSNLSPKKLPNNRQYSTNQYWRVPEKHEADSLVNKSSHNITNDGVYFTRNGNTILIPASGYYDGASNLYPMLAYFWTSTPYNTLFSKIHAFRFLGGIFGPSSYCEINAGVAGDPELTSPLRSIKLPIRPVIDKVTLTYKISESKNNTTSEKYSGSVTVPKGTKVKLTPIYDDCHTFLYWKNNDQILSGNNTDTITVTVDANDTYTAHFIQVEEITVTIISEDKNKGTVAFDDGNNEEDNQQE